MPKFYLASRPFREALKELFLLQQPDISFSANAPQGALFQYSVLSERKLPPLSTDLLLHSCFGLITFPPYMPALYHVMCKYKVLGAEIEALESGVTSLSSAQRLERLQQLHRSRVSLLSRFLGQTTYYHLGAEGVELVVPFVRELFGQSQSMVHALWTLFEPLTSLLSIEESRNVVLPHLAAVYEAEATTTKHMKLYHKSFVVQLTVRLGVATFLRHICNSIIEACAGFKDFPNEADVASQLDADDVMQCSITDVFLSSRRDEGVSDLTVANDDSFDAQSRQSIDSEVQGREDADQVSHDVASLDVADPDVLSSSVGRLSLHSVSRLRATDATSAVSEAQSPDDPTVDEIARPATDLDASNGSAFAASAPSASTEAGCNIRDVAAETVTWLAQRLGPVLSARFLSRNLLRMLAVCYLGDDQLEEVSQVTQEGGLRQSLSGKSVRGDDNARKVLECLTKVAALYGEQVIALQYFAHAEQLVNAHHKPMLQRLSPGLFQPLFTFRCQSLNRS